MLKKSLWVVLLVMIMAACSNGGKETKTENEEKNEDIVAVSSEVEEAETETDAEVEIEPEVIPEKRIFSPERELYKRDYVLLESEKGNLIYLGDRNTESGFYFALKYEKDMKYTNESNLNFRFIFDDGTDEMFQLFYPLDYLVEDHYDGEDLIRIFKTPEPIGDKIVKRIDYSFEFEEYKISDETKQTINVEETDEMITLGPLYELETFAFELNQVHEDEDKTITLKNLEVNEVIGEFLVSGEITYKEDAQTILHPRLWRPMNHTVSKGDADLTQSQSFGGIPNAFTINFSTEQMYAADEGAEIYIEVAGALFSVDLRTGEKIEKPVVLTPAFFSDNCVASPTLKGVQVSEGETLYSVLRTGSQCWNYGTGTLGKGTLTLPLGKNFNNFTFTLASGLALAKEEGLYDFYIFGDDFDRIHDTDELIGEPLLHTQVKGADAPKEFSIDVTGVTTLHIYYNTNKPAEGSVYNSDKKNLIQLLLIEPTLK